MSDKKNTKQEMTDKLYKHLEEEIRYIVQESPERLNEWLQKILQLYKMTKKELNAKFAAIFAVMDQPPLKAYRIPLTKITPENVILSEDDPMLPFIKVANEAYGDDHVMNYYKLPNGDFGDGLAAFIASEIPSGMGTLFGEPTAADYDLAADLIRRAAEQLEDVAKALEGEAWKLEHPEETPLSAQEITEMQQNLQTLADENDRRKKETP